MIDKIKQEKEMKRLTTLIALLALAFGLGAMTVTVAQHDIPTEYLPVYTWAYESYTQQIYPQHRINREGEISKLRFYHLDSANGVFENGQTVKIFLGHTSRNIFEYSLSWEPIANLTEVYCGPIPITLPLQGGEWIEFGLHTPFNYNNVQNLLVAVHSVNHKNYNKVKWGCQSTGGESALCYMNFSCIQHIDLSHPPYPDQIMRNMPALQLVFPDTELPAAPELISPAEGASWVNGQPLDWARPWGVSDASGYDVYLDGELVSENQPGTRYVINGLEPGEHTWSVVARNSVGCSPASETRTFVVEPGMVIGDGSEWYGLPIYPSRLRSYSQSIFLQPEIDISNHRIDKIAFYWNGRVEANNSNKWLIYMGHTDKTEFAHEEDWVPVSEMSLVFDGRVNIPAAIGWVEIELEYPFVYNNIDNLVIAVRENFAVNDMDFFYCTATPGHNRSLLNNEYMDHHNPPAGALIAGIPNILMRISELPENPIVRMLPNTLNFGGVARGESRTLNVTVTNMGGGTLNLSTANVNVVGTNADEFSIDPVNLPIALRPSQHMQIPVIVTGTTSGPVSAILRITNGMENHDTVLLAEGTPDDVVIIGDGNWSGNGPFVAGSIFDRRATLYTADQLNGIGTIDMVAWHCSYIGNKQINYKIYFKNTNEQYFSDQHSVMEQAIRVKSGQFIPNTLGWQMFQLDAPFYYTGGNLIVIVVIMAPQDETLGRYNAEYSYTRNGVENHMIWEYGHQYNGACSVNDWVPNIMLHFAEGGPANDVCALSLSGPLVPKVGEEAHYTVRVRNSGANVRANYQVKLMGTDDAELAVVDGPSLASGAIAEVVIPWTPNAVGQFSIYAKVVLPGDESDPNDQTKLLNIDVMPQNTQAVTIGVGNRTGYLPINFRFRATACQSIYLAEELGFVSGTINSMILYNCFGYSLCEPAEIYLGRTHRENLSEGLISASEMTLVYAGEIEYPAGENNIIINFQTPYVYTGGNLVIMCYRPWQETTHTCSNLKFRGQFLGDNRSRMTANYSGDIDLINPSYGDPVYGSAQVSFLYNADTYENELAAIRIAGDSGATLGNASNYMVRIKNYGSEAQTNYSVKLIGPDDAVLASVSGPPIGSMQSLDVEVPWTPANLGAMSIYGRVEMSGDEFAGNNCTPAFEVAVYPVGATGVFVMVNDGNDAVEVSWSGSRELTRYQAYRLQAGQEKNETAWTELIPDRDDAFRVTDTSWLTLPDGDYLWAVKAVYTDSTVSLPRFSDVLTNSVRTGKVMGVVKGSDNIAIAGATVSSGRLSAITNSLGEFTLMVPVGSRSLQVSAKGYDDISVENVVVSTGLFTNQDFVLWKEGSTPQLTTLHGNYPNPFNPKTNISYTVKEPGRVRLDIYNIKGQLVRNLINEYHDTGNYKRVFDGKDNGGRSLASGVYLIMMNAPGYQKASKMMLMK